MRHVAFVTGARSEYDLVVPAADAARRRGDLRVTFAVGAAHLSPFHGRTAERIREDDFEVLDTVESTLASDTDYGRAASFSRLTDGLANVFRLQKPDLVVVTGDREEALAGALAAAFMRIPSVHLHGGDRCIASDIDEVLRPAISKLAQWHCVATEGHRERLIRMGELPTHVFATGAPGIDRLLAEPDVDWPEAARGLGLDAASPFALVIHHPSPWLSLDEGAVEVDAILRAALACGLQVLCGLPNTDQGNVRMREIIGGHAARDRRVVTYTTLPRSVFVNAYRRCAVVVGNSSSIVIESGAIGTAAVLVGDRQKYRERGENVVEAIGEVESIRSAIVAAMGAPRGTAGSPYGDGKAGARIAEVLATVSLDPSELRKTMPY
jgi:GDP/UDP-N,N'-diacetylbacillosamine 2-epimerase (hydrolysing)